MMILDLKLLGSAGHAGNQPSSLSHKCPMKYKLFTNFVHAPLWDSLFSFLSSDIIDRSGSLSMRADAEELKLSTLFYRSVRP